jgi:putative hydrolase of the HAD superfamily
VTGLDAVVFDLDDTLCRHTGDMAAVYRAAFDRVGAEPFGEPPELWAALDGPLDPDDEVGYLGAGFARLAAQYDRPDADPVALAEALVAEIDTTAVDWLPGAEAALGAARSIGPVGVLTNGPADRQRAKVEALGLDSRVEAVVYAGDLPRRKPHVDPFERILTDLGVEAERTLHVGNSLDYDVAGAHNAGLQSAWLRADGEDPDDYRPEYVVDSLPEVEAILRS